MKFFFFAKKLAGTMLMPLQFSVVLLVCGIILLWLNRGRRLAVYLVTVGTGLLLIFSNPFVGYHAVHGLEAEYPPLRLVRPVNESASDAKYLLTANKAGAGPSLGQSPLIVVLSGGASNDPELPVADRLNPNSVLRVVEAVEIYRSLASSTSATANASVASAKEATVTPRILLSGGPTMNSVPEAIPMQRLAESLGIPPRAILMETKSDDTESEAKNVLPMAGHKPFILVTSAFHMPRSVALFRHLGMRPIPAPANYLGRRTTKPFALSVLPSTGALENSEVAWHEELGMLWERLRGQL